MYERVISARFDRIQALRQFARGNGLQLEPTNNGVRSLEEWFCSGITPDADDPTRPDDRWLAVAFDIGVFLGETMIERRPELRWSLVTAPKRDVSYQRPVITGFSEPSMYVDPVRRVSSLAFRVIGGWDEPTSDFLQMLWNAKATEDWSPRQSF